MNDPIIGIGILFVSLRVYFTHSLADVQPPNLSSALSGTLTH